MSEDLLSEIYKIANNTSTASSIRAALSNRFPAKFFKNGSLNLLEEERKVILLDGTTIKLGEGKTAATFHAPNGESVVLTWEELGLSGEVLNQNAEQ